MRRMDTGLRLVDLLAGCGGVTAGFATEVSCQWRQSSGISPPPRRTGSKSGQYEQVGPRGGHRGKEATIPKGHTLLPTDATRQGYILVDPTKNKVGRLAATR